MSSRWTTALPGPESPSPTRAGPSRVPLGVVRKAATEAGLAEVARLVAEHEAEVVVVGLPLTLRGEHGKQAAETAAFVEELRALLAVPVETADERFTTALAQRFGGSAPEDAIAAAHLLQGWLDRRARA